ncbi:protein neprosin [Ziziphus jujuba]|uniref:Protein neprosin n=1 Tax=Ziziphus jujuba TaxID=326968 RepID=A0A6P4AH34_ZIZJJ|nr:protein neprosin [Ziziphus jujuba]
MAKCTTTLTILLAMILIVLSDDVEANKATETSLDIDTKLKLLNKPAVKSIKSEDGDIIDCVDIYKQPAFDHPALRNHTIQMRPSFHVKSETSSTKNKTSHKQAVSQTWQKSGRCPNGTVPIRRIRREDLLRASSLENFGKKAPHFSHKNNATYLLPNNAVYINNTNVSIPTLPNRSAATLVTLGYSYIGASGSLNLWHPNVQSADDYTTAQIWLKHGPGDNFEAIESGYVVNPKLYGDTLTRLFAYWTVDAYRSTGCFDLTCTGFVQTGIGIALGASLGPWSVDMGAQYEVPVSINLDPNTGNWWLKVGENVVVGYWPTALFNYMKGSAEIVEWGGQVYSPNVKKTPHTTTTMGSGNYASSLQGAACYIKNVRIVDYSLSSKYPQWVGTWADEPYCYSAYNYMEAYGVEPVFYFGGPGRNPNCP